jgi:hypothetical protein
MYAVEGFLKIKKLGYTLKTTPSLLLIYCMRIAHSIQWTALYFIRHKMLILNVHQCTFSNGYLYICKYKPMNTKAMNIQGKIDKKNAVARRIRMHCYADKSDLSTKFNQTFTYVSQCEICVSEQDGFV